VSAVEASMAEAGGQHTTLLAAHDVTVRFGGVVALDNVSLAVPEGSTVGLVGPNGAGKTTLFGVLSGLLRPAAGRVTMGGDDVTRRSPQHRARKGLSRTFQRMELFTELTVREHLVLARRVKDGRERLLEVARALASDPTVMLLDEPSSGLDVHETEQLGAALRRVRAERGTAFVLVEHNVEFVLDLSDRITVLDFGKLLVEGTPDEIRTSPEVQAAYFGAPLERRQPDSPAGEVPS
jgi:ABC-type branched-subunit amino acid transport system ATPase component